MMLHIPAVLDQQRISFVRQILENANFVDGKLSAGMAAQQVKNNEELSADAKQIEQLNNVVMGSLVQHPMYQNSAFPTRIAMPFYARYKPGMQYGDHVDDPVMGPAQGRYRTDVSTTLFLSEPDEYEGGEIVIRSAFGDRKVKLAAGDAVVYPSTSLHHVTEVTSGERLVVVTWAQSMIRDPAKRELLYGLNEARESLLAKDATAEDTKKVDIAYANLFRMWAEI
ncbi:MAG: Fe2+-dependent dioxygenase [Gammaproteobacteria bacterium]|nr:Fe2+-dependent dioxygenase [Gammaproteobacteria bacterium]